MGVLARRWQLITAFTAVVVLCAAVVSFLLKPVYEPSARIEVDPPGSEAFSLQNNNSGALDLDNLIDTQTQILRSDQLAVKLVRELHLESRQDIVGPQDPASPSSATFGPDQLTLAESKALQFVQQNLRAIPIKNSRVIRISFAGHDPALSRDIVNALVRLYVDNNYQTRYDAVTQSSEWLSRQLADIRQKAEKSSQALAEYQKQHGIADVDDGGQNSTLAQKVAGLNQLLAQAQADRIQLEAFHRSIQQGKGDSLPQIRDNPVTQEFTKKIADTRAELSQTLVIYGKNHPNVQKLERRLAVLQAQFERQRSAILEGIDTAFAAARAREQLMLNQLNGVTADINSMGEYSQLKREAKANNDLYNSLYAKVKEAGIAAASKSSNIQVIEQARLLDKPTWPRPWQNISIAFAFGLVGGVALAFVRDRFDKSIRTPEEATQITGLPALAFVPRFDRPKQAALGGNHANLMRLGSSRQTPQPFVIERSTSEEAEAVRALHSSVLLSRPEGAPQVLLVVSSFPGEGKTTIAVNLAAALAEHAETCLIDGDLRRPAVGQSLGMRSSLGLADVLRGRAALNSVLVACPRSANLLVLSAGRGASNPGALLMSDHVREIVASLRDRFAHVVIDSPPLLAYADARALVPLADGVVVVARAQYTPRAVIGRSMEVLSQLHARVLGFVLNGVDYEEKYYRYYRSNYAA